MINHKFSLENAFQEILYRIANWINEGSGWIVKLIESQYINISTYRSFLGNSYVKLPAELGSSKNGLINTKNEDQKCFLWCHVRHINHVKIHPERITREDKKLAKELGYNEIEFHVQEKDSSKIETRNSICINVFGYENGLTFPICIKEKKLENVMDLLLVLMMINRIMCTSKILTGICFTKQRIKTRNPFARVVYSALVVKMC